MNFRDRTLPVAALLCLIAFARATPVAAADLQAAPGAAPAPAASPASADDPCAGPDGLLATVDRPTVGYSACAVKRGAVVLEAGYQNMFAGGRSPSVNAVYPQAFERFGAGDGFELDVIDPSENRMRMNSDVTTGAGNLGLGFKYELEQAGRFTYAFDGLFTAATGSGGFQDVGPSQTLNLDVAYALSPAMGISTTLAGSSTAGMLSNASATARYGTFDPSVVVTAQIPNGYQFFAELAALTAIAPQAGGRVFTDFGMQKLVGRNVDVDLEYAVDSTPVAGSRFNYLGFGFAVRAP